MASGTVRPGGRERPRPPKITTVSMPDRKVALASVEGLGVVGLDGMGVAARPIIGLPPFESFASFSMNVTSCKITRRNVTIITNFSKSRASRTFLAARKVESGWRWWWFEGEREMASKSATEGNGDALITHQDLKWYPSPSYLRSPTAFTTMETTSKTPPSSSQIFEAR